ncbi:MAG: glutamate racemase [Pyrinomonadaceae bacterium]
MSTDTNNELSSLPIGIFDSGVGGLTVYRALHNRLPLERFIYLGDTARVPYGTKSLSTVERYAIENAKFLANRGVKLLVVACNTASALALPAVRNAIGIDVIGVIGPGARKAVRVTESLSTNKIAVIATEATILSNAYLDSIKEAAGEKFDVKQGACPLFVPLAEEGWTEAEETYSIAAKYLREIVGFGPSALVLGCTHYPILKHVIGKTVGEDVVLIDSGEATAEEVENLLSQKNLANTAQISYNRERRLCDDLDHFFVTDAAERFSNVAGRFLGERPSRLEAIELT